MIPVYKPYLPPSCLKYAHDAIDSSWISSQGKYIQMAQEKLQELLNIKYVQLVNNGTSACHLVAKCVANKLNIHEIIVPNNVYVAAVNAFLFDNNFKLFSIECDLNTWNYDLNELNKAINLHPNAAVLIVHNIGNIINVPKLQWQYPNTIFVEDNCEGLLGKYENMYAGTQGFYSAISFFANKNYTSGEGGALITNDENAYLYARCVQGQGQSSKRFIHEELGYNYRMTNIQAALLYGQMEVSQNILSMKQDLFNTYRNAFQDREDILLQSIDPDTVPSNWMFGVRVPNSNYTMAEQYFNSNNIEIRPMFYSIDEHKHLQNNFLIEYGHNTNAKLLNKECFILPSFPELTKEESNYIINKTEEYIKNVSA